MITDTVTSLQDLVVPAGTVVTGVRFTLTPSATGAVVQHQDVVGAPAVGQSASFNVTDPDTYTLEAQAYDAFGTLLGSPVSASVTISAPQTITVQVPSATSAAVV